jgi:hypothetical protein
MARIKVDLPEPEAPISPTISPRSMLKLTLFSTRTWPKDFEMCRA